MIRLLRAIEWWLYKRTFIRLISEKLHPITAYPLIVWVIFEGKVAYQELGFDKFKLKLLEKSDEIANNLVISLLPEEKKPIEKRYRSISQGIERTRRWRKQEIAEQTERSYQVDQLDKLLEKTTFCNGEAKLN